MRHARLMLGVVIALPVAFGAWRFLSRSERLVVWRPPPGSEGRDVRVAPDAASGLVAPALAERLGAKVATAALASAGAFALTEDQRRGLSAALQALIPKWAAADVEGWREYMQALGGKPDTNAAAEMRKHWERLPLRLQPEGWRGWTDEQALLHLGRSTRRMPWGEIDLSFVRIEAPEWDNGRLVFSVEAPAGQPTYGGPPLWPVPGLVDALTPDGPPIVAISFFVTSPDGYRHRLKYWFAERGPGDWVPLGMCGSGPKESRFGAGGAF